MCNAHFNNNLTHPALLRKTGSVGDKDWTNGGQVIFAN
jgi:hypothetical protein